MFSQSSDTCNLCVHLLDSLQYFSVSVLWTPLKIGQCYTYFSCVQRRIIYSFSLLGACLPVQIRMPLIFTVTSTHSWWFVYTPTFPAELFSIQSVFHDFQKSPILVILCHNSPLKILILLILSIQGQLCMLFHRGLFIFESGIKEQTLDHDHCFHLPSYCHPISYQLINQPSPSRALYIWVSPVFTCKSCSSLTCPIWKI